MKGGLWNKMHMEDNYVLNWFSRPPDEFAAFQRTQHKKVNIIK